ncbi:UDP-N-acetylmuramoyl-L-alanine--D-glutamate ligase [Antrihabitans sp. YC2-6]|uniref:UDP-N-acetylmuramoyl-L-alanine--D-glutamate ligase n=1 Tax=Antrihabitans sp. YC2-6 TaxID=2799498 RepID=UPI0027DC97BF|nr:UDP-N-acetylmuramoyl-L-alanine--D-glutamate ligase [Antrihabitans sp. YC2-6]
MSYDLTDLRGKDVLVTGWGISGKALVEPLRDLGAVITVTSSAGLDDAAAHGLGVATADDLAEPGALEKFALVVTSPGWKPDAPVLSAAAEAGIPIWGDVELSWRMDQAEIYGPVRRWLVVTGTNGKTTTTSMLESVLRAGGISTIACGNIGLTVFDALRMEPRVDVLAVELSSFQLHWAPSVSPEAGVVLNIAEDHLDWHGGMRPYVDAKAGALRGKVGIVGLDDPVAASLRGANRTVGFRLGEPEANELGVRDGQLLDRAFGAEDVLAPVAEITPAGPAGVLDALAAAGLARSIGVSPAAVRSGLRDFSVGPHRAAPVGEVADVLFVDDSKATNPHAARSSILAHASVVWLAGGLLKGASVDELVAEIGPRLVGAVLIGRDRDEIAQALARHAPDVPVECVPSRDDAGVSELPAAADPDSIMATATRIAAGMARPGDAVLLAPAAASLDMFTSYGHRGDSFATAVRALHASDIGVRQRS